MKRLRTTNTICFIFCLQLVLFGQTKGRHILLKPAENKVFIKELGQFNRSSKEKKIPFAEPVLYGVQNAEFNAYFTAHGIIFQFPERKKIEEKGKTEGEKEEKNIETIQHTVTMQWLNTNPYVKLHAELEQTAYYNYGSSSDGPAYNFVPAYKKLIYTNLYEGVDAEFELPEDGGIKYKLIVHPNSKVPAIGFQWEGIENCYTDEKENLHIKSIFSPGSLNRAWQLIDHAPNAVTANTNKNIPVKYNVTGNKVVFQFSDNDISSPEGIVIDPWITNPNFPGLNRAFDIQEDGAGNVFVHGNYSETSSGNDYHVQKYNSAGVLQWTYNTYSIFLGDIAVDIPGNVYIIGGYPVGKRQKLDPSGVQLWVFPGLVEEWRLAFNYSKTVLAECGYFVDPGANNIGQLDMATGAVSNEIAYSEETRSVSTDCNGDMYSLHLPTSTLRKTFANFTPGGVVPSGLSLIYAGTGYAYNPDYSVPIYQGFNGNVIQGQYVYIYDGTLLRRFNKNTLTALNSVIVPGGINYQCSGLAADPCGNIYAGTTLSIEKYDSALNYISSIPTTGAVYDIILGMSGDLLACGEGFVGSFSTTCATPAALSATTTTLSASCGVGGSATIAAIGGIAPYTYSWTPGGQTTATCTNLAPGSYTYVVNDAFCKVFQGIVTISPIPVTVANFSSTTVCVNTPPTQFTDLSTGASSWSWDFGDPGSGINNISSSQNPTHIYSVAGTYSATLIASTTNGCPDTLVQVITVYAIPVVTVNSGTICAGQQTATLSATGAASYSWTPATGLSATNGASVTATPSTTSVYTITGTNINSCINTATTSVIVNALPNVTVNSSLICIGSSTVLTANGAVTYFWSPPGGLSSTNTSTVTANPNTTTIYTITGTDANSCFNTATSTVTVAPNPTVSVNSTSICIGQQTATLTAIGATTYNWAPATGLSSTVGTSVNANPNTTTTYTITGSIGTCTAVNTSIVTVNPLPIVTVNSSTICQTQQTATLTANGANTYSWTPTSTLSSSTGSIVTANPMVTLSYIVTGTDLNGCYNTTISTVTVNQLPTITANSGVICLGDSTILSSNGASTYTWSPTTGLSSATGNSVSASPGATTNYTITGTDSKGCFNTGVCSATVNSLPVVIVNSGTICIGQQTSSLIAAGANAYSWSPATGLSSASGSNVTANPALTTTYSVIGTDINGCKDTAITFVIVNPLPVLAITPPTSSGCAPVCVSFSNTTSAAGTCNWVFGDGTASSNCAATNCFKGQGTFYSVLTLTDANSCKNSDTALVIVYPVPNADFNADPQPATILDPKINFYDQSTGAIITNWNWTFGDPGQNFSGTQNPTFTYLSVGSYSVELVVTSDYGCKDSIIKIVIIDEDYFIYVPNAFSPNFNGTNDVFMAKGEGIKDFKLFVFDRWGMQIFYSEDIFKGWDGRYKGIDAAQEDIYVWKIELHTFKGEPKTLKGTVSLLK